MWWGESLGRAVSARVAVGGVAVKQTHELKSVDDEFVDDSE